MKLIVIIYEIDFNTKIWKIKIDEWQLLYISHLFLLPGFFFLLTHKYKCKRHEKIYIDLKVCIQFLVTLSDIF